MTDRDAEDKIYRVEIPIDTHNEHINKNNNL